MTNTRKAAGLDKFFGITAAGSTMRMEIMAGITTFFAMVYILMVNAGMFTAAGVSYGAIYIATAISAVVGTVCIGLLANLPLAQASGMGLNAFFVYTCVLGFGMSYANALVLVLFDGVLFIILTVWMCRRGWELPSGDLCLTSLTLVGCAQVILESLRNDGHMVVHFVRIQQVAYLLMVLAALLICSRRLAKRGGMKKSRQLVLWLFALLLVGVGVVMEFRVDRGLSLIHI